MALCGVLDVPSKSALGNIRNFLHVLSLFSILFKIAIRAGSVPCRHAGLVVPYFATFARHMSSNGLIELDLVDWCCYYISSWYCKCTWMMYNFIYIKSYTLMFSGSTLVNGVDAVNRLAFVFLIYSSSSEYGGV